MREILDTTVVHRWCVTGLAALRHHEHEINQLNVFPVPDGDTGTNLTLTLAAAEEALAASIVSAGTVGAALQVMARGALLGARGNSGVILAQWLRGLADGVPETPAADPTQTATALAVAAKAGYAAVARPVEGTILSVAAAAAAGAKADPATLAAVLASAAESAATALAQTPMQLPALATAGVVDAGGRGLVVLLDALVEVVTGHAPPRPSVAALPVRPSFTTARESGSSQYAYEVQYLLDADDEAVAQLRTQLGSLGDSLVVVGTGEGTWNVHVHVNDVGAAVEAGMTAGRPYQISVARFDEQMRVAEQSAAGDPTARSARGAVVAASGDGLVELFGSEGAVVVGSSPSTGEVLAAVRATGSGQVVVLPNNPNTHAVAAAAADEAAAAGIRVQVVPTHSPVQALAALAVRDRGRRFDDDVISMAEAAGACRYAAVCHAGRDALTVVGRCRAGDVLALVDGEVHLIGSDLSVVSRQLLDRMLGGGGELVTLLLGAEAPAGLGEQLLAHLHEQWPFVEVQVHIGGQPAQLLVVGVE